jgi:hypothetical protein
MTREEILNIYASYEMDAMIYSIVFGKMAFRANGRWEFTNERDYLDKGEGYYLGEHQEIIRLPKFSTDIQAAWEVVEKLANEPFAWHIESINLEGGRVTWWACLWGDVPDGSIAEYSAKADTVPLAICRAALLFALDAK